MEILEKGICRLTVVPIRNKPSNRSEMVTQLLFGDHYQVLEPSEDQQWLRIKIFFDGYEGWLSNLNHFQISQEYFDQINNSDYKICTDHSASIYFQNHYIHILLGSILPISTNELFKMEEQLAFNGESKSLGQKRDFEFIKETALKYLHSPYQWGGKTPYGIDCSGFTQQVFKIGGYKLLRDTYQQVSQGNEVSDIKEAKPGDLGFFSKNGDKISHVGILFAQDQIIHASGKVKIDQLDSQGIFSEELNKYTHKLLTLRRVLKFGP